MWDDRDGFPVSLAVICAGPITTIPQSQLTAERKLSEIHSVAGTEPLDYVIIHRPKSPPCTHSAIFMTRPNVFPQLHHREGLRSGCIFPLSTY